MSWGYCMTKFKLKRIIALIALFFITAFVIMLRFVIPIALSVVVLHFLIKFW